MRLPGSAFYVGGPCPLLLDRANKKFGKELKARLVSSNGNKWVCTVIWNILIIYISNHIQVWSSLNIRAFHIISTYPVISHHIPSYPHNWWYPILSCGSFFRQVNKRNGLTIGWANNGGIDQAPTSQITTYVVLILGSASTHSPWVCWVASRRINKCEPIPTCVFLFSN